MLLSAGSKVPTVGVGKNTVFAEMLRSADPMLEIELVLMPPLNVSIAVTSVLSLATLMRYRASAVSWLIPEDPPGL